MTTTTVVCAACNYGFGRTIDAALTRQVSQWRAFLRLKSGDGKPAPTLRGVRSAGETVKLDSEGRTKRLAKPFTVIKLADGTSQLNVAVDKVGDILRHLPNMAAACGVSEDSLLMQIRAAQIEKRMNYLDPIHIQAGFGGSVENRSLAKACLVLLATVVGNEEVTRPPYAAVRNFIRNGDDEFNTNNVVVDHRRLPTADAMERDFGRAFNCIYIRSDNFGKVLGHFTLYNLVAWRIILADSGGIQNKAMSLISNALDNSSWSAQAADRYDLPFAWLDSAENGLEEQQYQARFETQIREHLESERRRQQVEIIQQVVQDSGLVPGQLLSRDNSRDLELARKMSERLVSHLMRLPFKEPLSDEERAALFGKSVKDDE